MERKVIQHGRNAYASGLCRCKEVCRPEWRDYIRERRQRPGRATRTGRSVSAYYPQKTHNVTLGLTTLGFGILDAVQRREGRSYGDIFERLLREHGPTVLFDATAA